MRTAWIPALVAGLMVTGCGDSTGEGGSGGDAPGGGGSSDGAGGSGAGVIDGGGGSGAGIIDGGGGSGAGPACGDGTANGTEDCDSDDLDGQTCASQGFDEGALGCSDSCEFDTSACVAFECGDDEINGDDECDGDDLGGATCESQGFDAGTLGCLDRCTFDESQCVSFECGDGTINGSDDCEENDLGGQTCVGLGYDAGMLACSDTCAFDETNCVDFVCGDGEINGTDECEEDDLDGETCQTLGYDGGTLACSDTCAFDESGCFLFECGDGTIDPGEECEGVNLDGETCRSQGFHTGTLRCNAATCGFDTSDCANSGVASLEVTGIPTGFFPGIALARQGGDFYFPITNATSNYANGTQRNGIGRVPVTGGAYTSAYDQNQAGSPVDPHVVISRNNNLYAFNGMFGTVLAGTTAGLYQITSPTTTVALTTAAAPYSSGSKYGWSTTGNNFLFAQFTGSPYDIIGANTTVAAPTAMTNTTNIGFSGPYGVVASSSKLYVFDGTQIEVYSLNAATDPAVPTRDTAVAVTNFALTGACGINSYRTTGVLDSDTAPTKLFYTVWQNDGTAAGTTALNRICVVDIDASGLPTGTARVYAGALTGAAAAGSVDSVARESARFEAISALSYDSSTGLLYALQRRNSANPTQLIRVISALPDPVLILTNSIPNVLTSTAYTATLAGQGASALTWSIVGGTNNAWLSIDPATGALSGTSPSAPVTVTVTVRAQDTNNATRFDETTFTFTVSLPPYIVTSGTLPFVDISATGTAVPLFNSSAVADDDDGFASVTLPAPFSTVPFFGAPAGTTATVNANGVIILGTSTVGNFGNVTIPTAAAPNALIAPFWDDLDNVLVFSQADAVAGTLTVQWQGILYGKAAETVQYQVVIHQNGVIDFIYGPTHLSDGTEGPTSTPAGVGATVGLENQAGTLGTLIGFDQAVTLPSTSYTLTPN